MDFAIGEKDLKTAMLFGVLGAAGAVVSVLIAVSLPRFYLSLYIGLLAAGLGFVL